MAGRHKQPVDVIVARGKSHLTRAEKERRKAEEATVPSHLRAVQAPEYLSEWPDLVDAFYRYAEMLSDIMPEQFGQPDARHARADHPRTTAQACHKFEHSYFDPPDFSFILYRTGAARNRKDRPHRLSASRALVKRRKKGYK